MSNTVNLLINAMGGEGGGVLTGWIVAAARAQGLAVQATSVPGVAQRTGATTYYLEIAKPDARGRAPVFALFPVAGQVDIVLASELVEAGRAAAGGYVTPDRTTVVASTHRVLTMPEKTAMGDGRIDGPALRQALEARSKRAVLADLGVLAQRFGVPIGPVMLGALAAAEVLPVPRAALEDAIRVGGRAVDRNLEAFAAAFALIRGGTADAGGADGETLAAGGDVPDGFPAAARPVIAAGMARLADYQGRRYARLYLRRLEPFAGDGALCREVARQLALRMSYEDVMRVAQLKARPERLARIRAELGAAEDEPVQVADYLKPGVDELCDILPWIAARPLRRLAGRSPLSRRLQFGMRLKSTTVWGYSRLWLLAKLRFLRRLTDRYGVERKAIEHWLALVARAAETDAALAREIAGLAGLIKGYADTAQRGRAAYGRILDELVEPVLDGRLAPDDPAAAIAAARTGAMADPDGAALERILAGAGAATQAGGIQR